MKLFTWRRCSALLVSAGLIAAATTGSAFASSATSQNTQTSAGPTASSSASAAAAPSSFHGVNWADPDDNYNSGPVVPSGLSTGDSYATVYRITRSMVAGFSKNLGANTLRLPINPASVGTAWWNSYRATIDAATAAGDKVILSYWDETSSNDGVIDDTTTWNQMWNTVTKDYRNNPRVYFEPMNEPYGYTAAQWIAICTQWLADRTYIPRDRVVISGTGYNDNVTPVGAATALDGTLLSLHFYGYWASYTTEADWINNLLPRIGGYAYRTIIDEAGAPMTIGLNYGAHNGNTYTSYLAATTDIARGMGMGLVYWPGLRFGDSYSIESLGSNGKLTNNSATGVAQLKWGYGFGTVPPVNSDPAAPPGEEIIGSASGRCVDVPGFSTTGTITSAADSTLCLTTTGDATADGTLLEAATCDGSTSQSWKMSS